MESENTKTGEFKAAKISGIIFDLYLGLLHIPFNCHTQPPRLVETDIPEMHR